MYYIFSDFYYVVLAVLAFTFFILSLVEESQRTDLAKQIFSDETCFMAENTYKSVLGISVVKQVYKCADSTYEIGYDLTKYKE